MLITFQNYEIIFNKTNYRYICNTIHNTYYKFSISPTDMKKYIISFLPFLILLSSCEDSNEPESITDYTIKIQAVYFTVDDLTNEKPDSNAAVYIYYDTNSVDFLSYEYKGNGVFISQTDTITPNQTDKIDKSGYASFIPLNIEQPLTIGVESNYYAGRISLENLSSASKPINYKLINKP